MLKTKSTPKKSLRPESKTGSLTKPPSLPISGSSTVKGTPEVIRGWLMLSVGAFPARTLAVREEEKALTVAVPLSGSQCLTPFALLDRDSCSWRTPPFSDSEDSTPSSKGWPASGMMLDGVVYPLPKLEPSTNVTGCGLWRTPDHGAGGTIALKHLDEMARGNWKRPSGHNRQMRLLDQVRHKGLWPTPTATERSGINPKTGKGAGLWKTVTSKYPTPRAKHLCGGTGNFEQIQALNIPNNEKKSMASGKQLNPDWVEWLMGWPIGWTSLEPITEMVWLDWETDPADMKKPKMIGTIRATQAVRSKAFRVGRLPSPEEYVLEKQNGSGPIPRVATNIKDRVARLKAIGNGQVPQCAATAWKLLTEGII